MYVYTGVLKYETVYHTSSLFGHNTCVPDSFTDKQGDQNYNGWIDQQMTWQMLMSGAGEGEPKAKKDGKKPLMKPRPTEGC